MANFTVTNTTAMGGGNTQAAVSGTYIPLIATWASTIGVSTVVGQIQITGWSTSGAAGTIFGSGRELMIPIPVATATKTAAHRVPGKKGQTPERPARPREPPRAERPRW